VKKEVEDIEIELDKGARSLFRDLCVSVCFGQCFGAARAHTHTLYIVSTIIM
jgi:hypothetical protein